MASGFFAIKGMLARAQLFQHINTHTCTHIYIYLFYIVTFKWQNNSLINLMLFLKSIEFNWGIVFFSSFILQYVYCICTEIGICIYIYKCWSETLFYFYKNNFGKNLIEFQVRLTIFSIYYIYMVNLFQLYEIFVL